MREVTIHAYETSDGKQFATFEEAKEHQDWLDFSKVFLVQYDFDLTEGRGYYKKGLVMITAKQGHKELAENYCYNAFGERIGYVMGVVSRHSEVRLWTCSEITDLEKYRDLKTLMTITK